jgi:hypothetical protein
MTRATRSQNGPRSVRCTGGRQNSWVVSIQFVKNIPLTLERVCVKAVTSLSLSSGSGAGDAFEVRSSFLMLTFIVGESNSSLDATIEEGWRQQEAI